MEWLLKIVEGPMKGAEIALVAGSRVKFGSGDDCDIVIADRSMRPMACELDVSDSAITVIRDNGEAKELSPFTVIAFGNTAFAVGPAEGVWEELKPSKPTGEGDRSEPEAPRAASTEPEATPSGAAGQDSPAAAAASGASSSSRRGGLFGAFAVLAIVIVAGLLVWWFWPWIIERCPQVQTWCDSLLMRSSSAAAMTPAPASTLAEVARDYGLTLTNAPAVAGRCSLLKGNVKRRTERLAIRALALAAEPKVRFDLTDDESLCASANELLFVVTEGQLTAASASNRVVTLSGYAPTAAALERAVRALNADVPGVERLITTAVQVGGVPPKPRDSTGATVFETPNLPAAVKKAPAVRNYPIAGILTKPYPCVVMRSGLRLTEGAQVENVIIEKIEVDKLVLRDGKTKVEWKP